MFTELEVTEREVEDYEVAIVAVSVSPRSVMRHEASPVQAGEALAKTSD